MERDRLDQSSDQSGLCHSMTVLLKSEYNDFIHVNVLFFYPRHVYFIVIRFHSLTAEIKLQIKVRIHT